MKTKITLLIAFFISLGFLNAQDFTINGINYTITNTTNFNVEIAASSCYSGNLNLQSTVENNGTTYTITNIVDFAFSTCSALTGLTLPDTITEVPSGAFNYTGLVTVSLPNTITSINLRAFERCENLESINLPNSITTIGERAFERCENLKNVNFPISLTSIGKEAFKDCNALTEITIPDSITILNEGIFDSCELLQTVNLSNNLTEIGASAFNYNYSLTNLSAFPSTLKTIRDRAFSGIAVTSISIPNSVTLIEDNAFEQIDNLTTVSLPEGITSLGDNIFYDCPNLKNVTLPNSITSLGEGTFEDCTSLENIILPTSLTTIDDSLFRGCTSLKSIDLSNRNIIYVGSSAFARSGITSITIPDSVTEIESYAFENCTSLTNATLSENINIINTNLFRGCSNLLEITIPNNVKRIRDYAFRDCTNLASVNLSENLEQIDVQAFQLCSSLTKINIPESVTFINYAVFANCPSLLEVTVNWNNPYQPNNDIFVTTDISSATLKIPANTTSLYQNASPWKDFGTITEDSSGGGAYTSILDAEFEQYLVQNNIDSEGTIDGKVLTSDISSLTYLNVSNQNISDLSGIEDFTSLVDLDVNDNTLTTLNLTSLTNLVSIRARNNNLTSIQVSGLTNLEILRCSSNQLTSLNLSDNINLTELDFTSNLISELDVSQNTKLEQFYAESNKLENLDLSQNEFLTTVACYDNSLLELNIRNGNNSAINGSSFSASQNPNLTCIQVDNETYSTDNWTFIDGQTSFSENCGYSNYTYIPDTNFEQYLIDESIDSENILDGKVLTANIENITSLNISSKNITDLSGIQDFIALTALDASINSISSIDLTQNTLLEELSINKNQLTTINLSENTNLTSLNLEENQLTSLDVSSNLNLENINLVFNSFTTIDLSANTNLKSINVGRNNIATLNLTENIALEALFCNINQLIALDLSANTNLISLNCEQNSITYLDVSANENLTKIICNDNALIGLNMQNGNNNQVLNENFSAFANPNLFCILVDDQTYSEGAWGQIDMQTEFSTSCPELITIPDANFEAYLESINVGNGVVGDGYVFKESIETLTSLSIASKNITDTSGIEYFTNLTSLDIADNGLNQIDISKNILLEIFLADANEFTSFNLIQNTKLKTFEARSNLLTTLDVSTLVDLERLELETNQLSTLDLASNTKISILDLKNNQLENLDVSNLLELVIFEANNNVLRSINLKNTANPTITTLNTTNNPNLTCIEVLNVDYFDNISSSIDSHTNFYENCPSTTAILDANFEAYLESINVGNGVIGDNLVLTEAIAVLTTLNVASKNIADLSGLNNFTNLVDLNASDNNLTQIDISKNSLLEIINLDNNALTNVDFSKNFSLKNINVGDNQISNIDVYFLTELESLQCYKNQISTINLVSNKKLLAFVANENQLKTVDIRVNTALVWIDVDDNLLENLTIKNGNNSIITQFSTTGNPNLSCIEVDDVSFSETNWTNKDATANFSGDCAPANDDCAFAIPLVFGQSTPGDINSGAFTNATDCVAGPIIADVWYSITVPQTGELSIEGQGFGGLLKFALYESCASVFSISCGVNISLTNLTPGTVYLLKVWMEDTSTSAKNNTENGTFTLTANESSVLSVDDFSEESTQLLVYPNPAISNISIELSNNQVFQKVEVFSILGDKIITQKTRNKSKISVDISNLSAGIYFINAKTDNGILSKKLIIK